MNLFRGTPSVQFFSLIPEVATIAPILPASKVRPEWMDKAVRHYSELKQKPAYGKERLVHTAKCPGVYNLVRHGWVMTTWQDIVIKTNGDGKTFEWRTPADQKALDKLGTVGDYVSYHGPHQYTDFIGEDPGTLSCVLKIQTPWRAIVPKGYYLLEGPVPHSGERRFTTVSGYFASEYGVAQMNVQLLWHVMEGETLIKAGTPIAHYLLVPKDQGEAVIGAATEAQALAERVTTTDIIRRFVTDRRESKCLFGRFFQ